MNDGCITAQEVSQATLKKGEPVIEKKVVQIAAEQIVVTQEAIVTQPKQSNMSLMICQHNLPTV